MKKLNKQRQALLQRKRTKRNQSRKGKTYNPNKYAQVEQRQQETVSSSETIFV